jgi:hypothetical protein
MQLLLIHLAPHDTALIRQSMRQTAYNVSSADNPAILMNRVAPSSEPQIVVLDCTTQSWHFDEPILSTILQTPSLHRRRAFVFVVQDQATLPLQLTQIIKPFRALLLTLPLDLQQTFSTINRAAFTLLRQTRKYIPVEEQRTSHLR